MSQLIESLISKIESLESQINEINASTKEIRDERLKQPVNKFGIYSAICVSTSDPWKQNRVQWFSPIFDDPTTAVSKLPWALPISNFGGFDDSGSNWIPPAGSTVIIAFEGGTNGAAYYLGTTWCRERGRGGTNLFNVPVIEYDELYAFQRNNFLCGPNDGSQVFPPWNTESYNGFDIDSINEITQDPTILLNETYPNIYGFKTPEKHMMKMVDGDGRCNRKWKRIEIMSGNGNWMIFKDDHLHYCGQWASPSCVGESNSGDASGCVLGPPNSSIYNIENAPNTEISIDISGANAQTGTGTETTGCSTEDRTSILGGEPMTQTRTTSQGGRNPFFKQRNECRPYKGPQTPQNNKCDLPQTGVQILSISGHTFVMDDSVNQPRGGMTWDRSTAPFDFGCDNKFVGRSYWRSTTGHFIELNDLEKTEEGFDQTRSDNNGVKIKSALGNEIFLCDGTEINEVNGGGCKGKGSPNQGIRLVSTSNHQIIMSDEGNEREYPCRRDGAVPFANSNSAYMQLRSGYGLQITLNDSPSQNTTQGQSIDIIAPQKSIENGARPHVIQLQEGYSDIEESGFIQVRSGGNLFLYAYENALELIEGHKIVYTKTNRLDYTENNFFHIGKGNHVVKVDEKIFLLAGRDYPPPQPPDENGATSTEPSPPENLLRQELNQATNQATAAPSDECVPGVFPVLVLMPNGCVRASDRVYASCSNAASSIGLGNFNIAAENCQPGEDLCSGGLPLEA